MMPYILACMNNGPTIQVRFDGLPPDYRAGHVVFEDPRKVEVKEGAFTDWFAPFDVHVYRFSRR